MSDDEDFVSRAIEVEYCPHCTLPPEYCEFGTTWGKCQPWLKEHHPELLEPQVDALEDKMKEVKVSEEGDNAEEDEEEDGEKKKKKSKRGGKTASKMKEEKKAVEVPKFVHISKSQRNKRKFITSIKGIETLGLNLKKVSKDLAKQFACSASVNAKEGEISIQGDITMDLPSFLVSKFEIDKSLVFFVDGPKKKRNAFED